MRCIAVDIGGTWIKSARIKDGKVGCSHRTPFPPFASESREVHAPTVVREVREEHLNFHGEADSILLCGQMGGVVVDDVFHSWQRAYDSSVTEHASVRRWKDNGNEIYQPGTMASILFNLKRTGRLPPKTKPLSLPDYVASELIGKPTFIHPTLACASGVFQLCGRFDFEAIDSLGLLDLNWPLVPNVDFLPKVGDINVVQVMVPVGDQQAALFGCDLQPGELSINIGTGGQVSVLTEKYKPGNYQTRPYFGKWLNTVTHLPAGRTLATLANLTDWSWDDIDQAAATAKPTPVLPISFLPHSGLSIGGLFRWAFEEMATHYKYAAETLGGGDRIVFSGGVVRGLPTLRRIIEERLGLPSRIGPEEETLHGLAKLHDLQTRK